MALLPERERKRLAPELELVFLDVKDSLYREDEPIDHVYFPISGVLSLVSQMEDGREIEVATIGNEGMVDLPVFLQATLTSAHMACDRSRGSLRRCKRVPLATSSPAPRTVA